MLGGGGMMCTVSGREAVHCSGPKSAYWYEKGCRCEAARKLHRERMRRYGWRRYAATCPVCGQPTKRASGVHRGCEAAR